MNNSVFDRMPKWVMGPWIILLLAMALYANTIMNGFALDDGLVLNENAYVRKGVAGIPEILAHDSFHGAIGNSAYLSGGRYRPLSLITYAIEVSFFGVDPVVHHFISVLLFALNCLVLYRFLERWVFPTAPWATWIISLLFAIHPVHVEAVANIKGRDELLSLLFILLTLHHALLSVAWSRSGTTASETTRTRKTKQARSTKKTPGEWSAVWMPIFFALALLSKENGLILFVLLPVTLYVLADLTPLHAIRRSWPVLALVFLYIGLRVALLDARNNVVQEIMDNPYLAADLGQKIATILYVHLRYLGLLFWPDPLTYDYSFNTIPYRRITDPFVLLSLIMHTSAMIYAIIGLRKRSLLAWCILFYLGSLALVNNLFFNVGAPMAERFLYQASIPFLIGLVAMLRHLATITGLGSHQPWIAATMVLAALPFSAYQIIERNTHWRSGDVLFLHDVQVVPNSVRAQTFAGIALIHRSDSAATVGEKRELAWLAVDHFKKADALHSTYLPTLLNMGLAYLRLDSMAQAEACWDRARLKDPLDPKLLQLEAYLFDKYYRSGVAAGTKGDYETAVADMEHALRYGPTNANAWYDLGGICYTARNFPCARKAWERTLQLAPQHPQASQGMAALSLAEKATANEP